MNMDLMKITRRSLPTWAKSLAPEAKTPTQLKSAVRKEISEAYAGRNPLTAKQIAKLDEWLRS